MSSTPVVVLPTDPTTASSASSWDLNQITNANNNNIAHPPAATTTTTTDPKSAAVTSTDALASHKPVHAPDPSAAAAEMPKFVTATTGRKREVTGNWLPDFSVRGKVIAVTGGARGLGFAMAEGLVEGGAVGMVSFSLSLSLSLVLLLLLFLGFVSVMEQHIYLFFACNEC